jgi:hypothetical protein
MPRGILIARKSAVTKRSGRDPLQWNCERCARL